MLSSVSYEVLFSVRVQTQSEEIVCVTGDGPELGNWEPHKAVKLRRETKRQLSDSNLEAFGRQNSHNGDVWSKKLRFSGQGVKKYRYMVCRVFQSDNEEEEESVIVTQWETNIAQREFSVSDFGKDFGREKKPEDEVAVFGEYGGRCHVAPGWLIDQSLMNIQIHDNPIKMLNTKSRNQTYSIKCTAIDHRDDHIEDEDERELPVASKTVVNVCVLEKGLSKPCEQTKFGAVYPENGFMCLMIQALEPEHTGFQLDFYVHSSQDGVSGQEEAPRHVGYSFILPIDIQRSVDSKTIPITSLKHKPLGHIKIDYLFIKPLRGGHRFKMDVSYQNYWKSSRGALEIGHRGMGMSYCCKELAFVTENTVQSLQDAANHGADYVEFDVHLTKDREVIIYHDFKVKLAYRKKKLGELELLEVPVKDLTLSELQSMTLWHREKPENMDEIQGEDTDPEDLQPFPTLQRCFEGVDIHTGFQIEIKFPQRLRKGYHEQDNFFDVNEFIDTILQVVMKHHNGRRIIFSSFDCDTCIALRLKQNRYPVLFLTQADTEVYDQYKDSRTHSVKMAAEFCHAYGLLGVNAMSPLLLKDRSLIDYVKDSGLVLFAWGEENNDSNTINFLKQNKLDGIIYDRIDHFKTSGKESIFKVEHNEKMLQKFETEQQEYDQPIVISLANGHSSS